MKTINAAIAAAVLAAGLMATAIPAQAAGSAPSAGSRQCFRLSQMRGWKPTPDARGMYFRVNMHDVYLAELQGSCPMLRSPGAHLVNRVTSDMICSPIEFDLRVSDNTPGFSAIPCLVKSYRLLSPTEVETLPKKLRP